MCVCGGGGGGEGLLNNAMFLKDCWVCLKGCGKKDVMLQGKLYIYFFFMLTIEFSLLKNKVNLALNIMWMVNYG